MKKLVLIGMVLIVGFWSASSFSQNRDEVVALGLPGDNFNLYAVLDVFQKSKTFEDFEREINTRGSNINNLDLNNDGYVDYISVVSYNQGHFHSIVLRDSFGSDDYQDVAVIEVSKNNAGKVLIQLIGDEALYGDNYIVEPSSGYTEGTPNPGYTGAESAMIGNYSPSRIVFVNDWPIVLSLFSPHFSLYISPWYWGYYPVYWSPWAPIGYHSYWSFHFHYYSNPYYHRISFVRFPSHHSYYLKRRYVSPLVVVNRRTGVYRQTYNGVTYRKPATPTRLSRTEVRREVRRSRNLDQTYYSRQESTQSGRRQVQPNRRSQSQESGRRQVNPQSGNFDRRPVQRTQSEPVRYGENPVQRQESRPKNTEQKREINKREVRPVQRQEIRQISRPQSQPANRPATINPPSRVSRQSDNEIRRINRSESKSVRPSNNSGSGRRLTENKRIR